MFCLGDKPSHSGQFFNLWQKYFPETVITENQKRKINESGWGRRLGMVGGNREASFLRIITE